MQLIVLSQARPQGFFKPYFEPRQGFHGRPDHAVDDVRHGRGCHSAACCNVGDRRPLRFFKDSLGQDLNHGVGNIVASKRGAYRPAWVQVAGGIVDFLAYLQGKRAEREAWGVHAGGGATMNRRVEAGRRRELEAKALMYRPRNGTVSEDVIEVIRLILLAGVRAHGDGGVVRGVASDRDLTTAGGVLVRFLPSVCALGGEYGDLEACFGRDLIRWWSAPGGFCKEGADSRDKAVLMWARSWVSDDPVATWLGDKLHPDPPQARRVEVGAKGYCASELAEIFLWCERQNTQRRRDVCAAVVALCFGAGLSAAELRLVDAGDVVADGSTVTVGDKILPVRAEVRSALVDLQDRNALLAAVRNPLSLVPHPASCRVKGLFRF